MVVFVTNNNEELKMEDSINPEHYKKGGIETIEYMKAKMSKEEFYGYIKGNALKYISREGLKVKIGEWEKKYEGKFFYKKWWCGHDKYLKGVCNDKGKRDTKEK